jgi:DNA-binding transcriptional LysR family regulator
MRYTLGFIGCGNMGGALVTAASREVVCNKIAICDYDERKTSALEQEFGVKLFIRSKRGIRITEEGKQLEKKITAVISAEEELYQAAEKLSRSNAQSLRIGTYSSIALHVLPKLLHGFKQAHPSVKTQILVDDDMHNWLENGTADIILADTDFGTDVFLPLIEDVFVAVVPETEFSGRETIALEELHPYALIRPKEECLDSVLQDEKFREIIPVASIENDSAVYMVREGLGVAILPRLSTRNCPSGVKILQLQQNLTRTIGVSYHKTNGNQACQWFVRYVTKAMKKATT